MTLFRRRQVWLPTAQGLLLLLAIVALLVLAAVRGAVPFMMLHDPAHGPDGRGAATLVVEGWLDEAELDQALATARGGRYARIVTTGGPIESWARARNWSSFAARAAGYLAAQARPDDVAVIAVPAPASKQDRTFLSAVMLRAWARDEGVRLDAIDLYSAGVHARRSALVFRMALGPQTEVGVLAATPTDYDLARWWGSSAGVKTVIGEALSLAWTTVLLLAAGTRLACRAVGRAQGASEGRRALSSRRRRISRRPPAPSSRRRAPGTASPGSAPAPPAPAPPPAARANSERCASSTSR